MKCKTIHGVRTGNHDNPNVVRSTKRYERACGGAVGGQKAPGRPVSAADGGITKRAAGGRVKEGC